MSKDLVLEGLSPLQIQIANVLWQIDTEAEIDSFIQTLPKRYIAEAIAVKELMIAACIDQAVEETEDLDLAKELLEKYRPTETISPTLAFYMFAFICLLIVLNISIAYILNAANTKSNRGFTSED